MKSTNYIRMFEGTSMPFLINSIAFKHYRSLQIMSIFRDNLWTTYLPKDSEIKTLKLGLELFSSKEKFESYMCEFEDYKKRSKEFLDSLIRKDKISLEELKETFDIISEHWKYYQKTEFFYVDGAFKQSKENKTIQENLKKLESIKNSGRGHLNSLIFGDGSYLTKIIVILAKQFNKKVDDLLFYTSKEIFELYEGNEPDNKVLGERRKSYCFFAKIDGEEFLQGKESEEFIKNFLVQDLDVGEIKGIVANPGKVKGKAKVIRFGYEDFDEVHKKINEMNKGDILIAETTAPELMAACKKAAAIVTNQGGLLSHAAIVSRELGIPCIVGTESAVEIIKDGDLIDVDADNGIVRIIKND